MPHYFHDLSAMQSLLLIDTASRNCGVYLSCKGELRQQVATGEKLAAQRVLTMIEGLLSEVDVGLSHLHGIGVINGPGSFTGMRIGVAVAQALAYTNRLPVVPVSTMEALACSANAEESPVAWLVALPARDKEFYLGAYQADEAGQMHSLIPDQVVAAGSEGNLGELAARASVWGIIGEACEDESVLATLGPVITRNIVTSKADQHIHGGALMALLGSKLAAIAGTESVMPLPNYVKDQMEYSK